MTSNDKIKINPLDCISPHRFDNISTYLYAKHHDLKLKTNWFKKIYLKCKSAFNQFRDPITYQKKRIQDFIDAFNDLIKNIKKTGKNRDPIPVSYDKLINCYANKDGKHRIGICLAYDMKLYCRVSNNDRNGFWWNCIPEWFIKQGLDQKYIEYMTYEYLKLKPEAKIFILYPSEKSKLRECEELINQCGYVLYKKKFLSEDLTKYGEQNIIRILYKGNKWYKENGGTGKANNYFKNPSDFCIYFIHLYNDSNIISIRNKIKKLLGNESHLCRITITHPETIKLSQLFLNRNSIHHINSVNPKFLSSYQSTLRFGKFFNALKKCLSRESINYKDLCIVGPAVLSCYGLRDCSNLDIICHESIINFFKKNDINLHNYLAKGNRNSKGSKSIYPKHYHDIIYNPNNYFYFEGIKVASLPLLRDMKLFRYNKTHDKKDKKDLALINKIF